MSARPRASVIIAAYRSGSVIAACLDALARQTFTDFEAIVVNSSPSDDTREIVTMRFPAVKFIEHPTRLLPHAARNLGVASAIGRVLVFTDADCRGAPDWLERCLAAVDAGHHVVSGSIEPAEGGWFATGVHLCKYSFRLSTLRPGPTAIAGTANAAYTRDVWDRAGPFDGSCFSGDAMLAWRAARLGTQPWFEPTAIVRHVFDHSFRDFWRERRERGADFAKARMVAGRWSTPRLLVAAAGFVGLAGLALLRGARDAVQGGWARSYIWTLPVQYLGHLAWSLGEADAAVGALRGGRDYSYVR